MTPLHQLIRADVDAALGAVLSEERKRMELAPRSLAARAEIQVSSVRAFECGRRQPNFETFITLAWCLDQDPREVFDKVLRHMGMPPGSRMVINKR